MAPFFLTILGAASLWSTADSDAMAPSDAAMIASVAACGIPAGDLTVEPAQILATRAIRISTPSSRLSDAQLACIASIYERDGTWIGLADSVARPRYEPIWNAADIRRAKRFSKDWLSANNLLDRLPIYDPKADRLADYVVRLEQFCSYRPHTIVRLVGPKKVELTKVFWADDGDNRKRECIVHVIRVADLERLGVMFGFPGNEYVKP